MRIYLALLAMTYSILLSSCKKYDEGPRISFLSKKYRIEGKWKASSVILNNQEIMGYSFTLNKYNVTCTSGAKFQMYDYQRLVSFEFNFKKDDNLSISSKTLIKEIDGTKSYLKCDKYYLQEWESNYNENYYWEFDKKKENVITVDKSGYNQTYEILELREKRIKLKRVEGTGANQETVIFTLEKSK